MKIDANKLLWMKLSTTVLCVAGIFGLAFFRSAFSETSTTALACLLLAILLLNLIILIRLISARFSWIPDIDFQSSGVMFKKLLDSAPDAMIIVNEQGRIMLVNIQTETVFGYRREELMGRPIEILIPQELRSLHEQHRKDYQREPKVRSMGVGMELEAVKQGGQRFPVEISLSPMKTKKGMLILASIRDITDRKNIELALIRRTEELEATTREMEAFTYSVSHDLRAPLRGIIGFTSILEEEYGEKLDEEGRRIMTVIRNNTIKMGQLIDALLNFSRIGKKEIIKTHIRMNELVSEVIETADTHGKPVDWKQHPLPDVYGDLSTIRQVWINLVSNAIKYSGHRESPVIEIGHYNDNGHNGQDVFYIRDNGIGFDEKYKEKLFKVFQRLHSAREFEGTGVGLAIVEKIITKHGGRVWAESEVEKGAVFYFSLPNLQ